MALIKTYNSTPTIYSTQSRDFQLIGHLYETVFNSSKVATDMLDRMMPNSNFDERLLNLSTTTVGFVRKHEYNTQDLTMILSSFAYLLRRKGTASAIKSAINILLRSQGIADAYHIEIDPKTKYIELGLNVRLQDIVLLTDLFAYLLPFGFDYRIIPYAEAAGKNVEKFVFTDSVELVGTADNPLTNNPIVNETFTTTIDALPDRDLESDPLPTRPIIDGEVQEGYEDENEGS